MFDLNNIGKKVQIIAEAGCNHNGIMNIAEELVIQSSNVGADAVKFQTFKAKNLSLESAPKASYQIKATGTAESQYERLKRMEVNQQYHKKLIELCNQKNITFCSSPFDIESATFLYELNVPFYKIPSGELTNIPLIEHIAAFNKPIILSTGMANLGEIELALNKISKCHNQVILMHCTSDYPAKWEESNLKSIQTLKNAFKLPVGFSDHTQGIELSLIAVALGAVVIEKHISLDNNMEGGDHKASLEPKEFKELVDKVRKVEVALGDGIKRCMESEVNVRNVARKSVVSIKDIEKGERIQKESISVKRPGNGISPIYFEIIHDSVATERIPKDSLIYWHQILSKKGETNEN